MAWMDAASTGPVQKLLTARTGQESLEHELNSLQTRQGQLTQGDHAPVTMASNRFVQQAGAAGPHRYHHHRRHVICGMATAEDLAQLAQRLAALETQPTTRIATLEGTVNTQQAEIQLPVVRIARQQDDGQELVDQRGSLLDRN